MYKYLFGPVPSRRLGISLGVDLVPYKVCSMNCVYCEVGATTELTLRRKEYISLDKILKELDQYLSNNPKLDYITFSGAGEPLLNSGVGKIIEFIKLRFPNYKLCLITNSSLLYDANVRNEIKNVDLVLPSIDAFLQESYEKINRAENSLTIEMIKNGIIEFAKEFSGKIWLEYFVIKDINDSEKEIMELQNFINIVKPDQVQLNSLDRPGTEKWVKKTDYEDMLKIKNKLKGSQIKIITKFNKKKDDIKLCDNEELKSMIIEIIKRRPCTAKDIADVSGSHINEVNKYLRILEDENKIKIINEIRGTFYKFN